MSFERQPSRLVMSEGEDGRKDRADWSDLDLELSIRHDRLPAIFRNSIAGTLVVVRRLRNRPTPRRQRPCGSFIFKTERERAFAEQHAVTPGRWVLPLYIEHL